MLSTFRSARFIKVIMLTVAVSFVGLMVFDWGADISGRKGRRVGDTIGSINGVKISYKQFEDRLRDAYLRAKAQGKADPEQAPLIHQEWNQIVNRILLDEQIEKFGVSVSDKEVNFYNRTQPPASARTVQDFQTEGEFDPAKYAQFLDDPATYGNPRLKRYVLWFEDAARQSLLDRKLQGLVAVSARVTGPEVRQAYINSGEKTRVAYAGLEATALADSLVSVSDAEAA